MPWPSPAAPVVLTPAPGILADPALGRVLAALPGARIVGGAVRDALAGRPVMDVDLATPMLPADVVQALAASGLKSVPTGLEHGTVTAVADHRGFEVTTLRRDVETDGRHAVVAYTDDWREDAARRDFTINAMSLTQAGEVFDYFGGIADLAAGRVRFVGDPATRIAEDYLRILRYFRFLARYGAGDPDPEAIAAIHAAVTDGGIERLSVERIWSELKRILGGPDPDRVLTLMRAAGMTLLPAPQAGAPFLGALPADPLLRLAALRPGDVSARFRLSTAERDRLLALQEPSPPEEADDAALRRLLADTPPDILIGRSWIAGRSDDVRARLAAMDVPRFPLRGRDLQAAGIAPGPEIGALLRDLRGWWLAGGCIATAADLRAELARRCSG